MSVVPLIRETTIVKSRDEFDAAGGRQGEKILILDLDEKQLLLDAKDESNVTYDLRVGKEYRDHRYRGKADIGKEGIKLSPNSAVIIQTLEQVYVPKCRFGYIVPKVSLLQKGISNTSSKVDPGYEGRLLITVFNLGKRTVRLKLKEKFCTIAFHEVADRGIRLYGKGEKRLEGSTYTDLLRKFLYGVRRNGSIIFLAASLLAVMWVPKFADFIEHKQGATAVISVVVGLVIIYRETSLFHKIGEILERFPPE